MDACDAIITGTGTSGGTLARQLAPEACPLFEQGAFASSLWPRHAYMKNEIAVAGCAHQAGTCRFGMDPVTSALGAEHRLRAQLDNLYVVTSVFPEHRGGEPGVHRDTFRVCERLLTRLA